MSTSALLPIAADRAGPCLRTLFFVGYDLTGVDLRMQVRLYPDTPGLPLINLLTVTGANAEGLRLAGVTVSDGVPTSEVRLRVNESTMKDAAKVPYDGELGDASVLSYDLIGIFGQDKRRLVYGDFVALPTTYGSDAAPASRPTSNGRGGAAYSTWREARLTIGSDTTSITVDGVDLLEPLVRTATTAVTQAAAFTATAQAASASAAAASLAAAASSAQSITNAAVAGQYRQAVEQAVSGLPAGVQITLQAASLGILKSYAANYAGRQALLYQHGKLYPFVYLDGDQSALASSDPFGGIYVTPDYASTGSQGVWMYVPMDDVFDVRRWGITRNNAANDNGVRLRAAIRLVPPHSELRLPTGNTPIETGVRTFRSDIVLSGFGRRSTTLTCTAHNGVPMTLWGNNLDVRGIHFKGTGDLSFAGSAPALMLGNGDDGAVAYSGWSVDDCEFSGTPIGFIATMSYGPANANGREAERPDDITITNCTSRGRAQGYSMFGVVSATLNNNRVYQDVLPDQRLFDTAVRILGVDHVVIDGLVGRTTGHHGIICAAMNATSPTGQNIRGINKRITLRNIDLDNATQAGIVVYDCSEELTVQNVVMRSGDRNSTSASDTAIVFNPNSQIGRINILYSEFIGYGQQISGLGGPAPVSLQLKGSRFISNKNNAGYVDRMLMRWDHFCPKIIEILYTEFLCMPVNSGNIFFRFLNSTSTVRMFGNTFPEGIPAALYEANDSVVTMVGRPANDVSYVEGWNGNYSYHAGAYAALG